MTTDALKHVLPLLTTTVNVLLLCDAFARFVPPQGRYREFYQCDFDIAGNYASMVPDAECVTVACEILSGLPVGNFMVKVNHRKLLDAVLEVSGVDSGMFRTICSAVDKLDKEPWEAVKKEMIVKGITAGTADKIGKLVMRKAGCGDPFPLIKELEDEPAFGAHGGAKKALGELRTMFEYLDAMGTLKFVSFDMSLARGLDYYTGVIYEAVCVEEGTQVGSIGGGGRYDGLAGMFSGTTIPCVGVSVGIERVFTLMEKNLEGKEKRANVDVLVASTSSDGDALKKKMSVARACWEEGVSAEFSELKLKFALKDALDRGVPYLIVVGDEEWKVGNVKIKELAVKVEEEVAIGDVAGWVKAREGGIGVESGGSTSGSSRPAAKKEKKVFAWDEKDFIR